MSFDLRYRVGLHVQTACVWEATARKPGNVHPSRSFEDAHYLDFVLSAAAVAPVFAAARENTVGQTVHESVRLTRLVVGSNTNLGMLLLLAPLAKAAGGPDLRQDVVRVLDEIDAEDAGVLFAAIRLANPGGLGRAPEQDVAQAPTLPLRAIMALAADRDLIARQYANDFREVFDEGAPAILDGMNRTGSMEGAILFAQLHLMARHPDTLIARKRGSAEAVESAQRAQAVLDAGWPKGRGGWAALAALDAWLRAEGRQRNPGTTADLIAACLFVLLHDGRIPLPLPLPWPADFDADLPSVDLPQRFI
jgi:triphosphoribosyl-dephospho-CoA synthase